MSTEAMYRAGEIRLQAGDDDAPSGYTDCRVFFEGAWLHVETSPGITTAYPAHRVLSVSGLVQE